MMHLYLVLGGKNRYETCMTQKYTAKKDILMSLTAICPFDLFIVKKKKKLKST